LHRKEKGKKLFTLSLSLSFSGLQKKRKENDSFQFPSLGRVKGTKRCFLLSAQQREEKKFSHLAGPC
jgi:hypothetical protein